MTLIRFLVHVNVYKWNSLILQMIQAQLLNKISNFHIVVMLPLNISIYFGKVWGLVFYTHSASYEAINLHITDSSNIYAKLPSPILRDERNPILYIQLSYQITRNKLKTTATSHQLAISSRKNYHLSLRLHSLKNHMAASQLSQPHSCRKFRRIISTVQYEKDV